MNFSLQMLPFGGAEHGKRGLLFTGQGESGECQKLCPQPHAWLYPNQRSLQNPGRPWTEVIRNILVSKMGSSGKEVGTLVEAQVVPACHGCPGVARPTLPRAAAMSASSFLWGTVGSWVPHRSLCPDCWREEQVTSLTSQPRVGAG